MREINTDTLLTRSLSFGSKGLSVLANLKHTFFFSPAQAVFLPRCHVNRDFLRARATTVLLAENRIST